MRLYLPKELLYTFFKCNSWTEAQSQLDAKSGLEFAACKLLVNNRRRQPPTRNCKLQASALRLSLVLR